jgi:hypothetical protein
MSDEVLAAASGRCGCFVAGASFQRRQPLRSIGRTLHLECGSSDRPEKSCDRLGIPFVPLSRASFGFSGGPVYRPTRCHLTTCSSGDFIVCGCATKYSLFSTNPTRDSRSGRSTRIATVRHAPDAYFIFLEARSYQQFNSSTGISGLWR